MSRSDAARRANASRRSRITRDVDALRDGHFTGDAKSEVREQVVSFLKEYTPNRKAVGDLLGPGWSSAALHAAGMRVLAVDDCSWSSVVLGGDRTRAEKAARRIAKECGVRLRIGPFRSIVGNVESAFYDSCGPYLAPTSRDVRAMASANLRAFVVTVLFARVEGMKGKPPEHYRRLAEVGLEVDAPNYDIERVIEYRGESNLPMAAFFLLRKGVRPFVSRDASEPLPQTLTLASAISEILTAEGGSVNVRRGRLLLGERGFEPSPSSLTSALIRAGVISVPMSGRQWEWRLLANRRPVQKGRPGRPRHADLQDRYLAEVGGSDKVGALARALGVTRGTARKYLPAEAA